MTNQILFGEEGREKLILGVDKLSNAVKTTLGAKGKNVIIGTDFGLPIITKDGVTVAKSIMLDDYVENMGASLVKEIASKTAEVAGDGTTTSVVLAQAILHKGIMEINAGGNQLYIKSGIDKAAKAVIEHLKKISLPIEGEEQLISIASISANNDAEIGKLIGEAVSFVGVDGIISIEESGTYETSVSKIDGLKFGQGFIDQHFVVNSNKNKIEMEDVVILMYDKKISTMGELIPLLNQVADSKKSLLIIAEDVEGEALKSLIVNNMQKKINVCCVKSPGYGTNRYDLMNDIAAMTSGLFISEDLGIRLENVSISNLGVAKKVTITKDKTVIVGGSMDNQTVAARVLDLKEMIDAPKDHDVKFLKHRLANLTNGVASIKVGGTTEVEVSEKIDRIDDALNATISSLEEGYVVGGGYAFLECLKALEALEIDNEEEQIGVNILKYAITKPYSQILENAGLIGNLGASSDYVYGMGTNVKTLAYENLLETGIIDPTKVSRVALENAVSIAGTFLTTDCIILNISDLF